MSLKEMAVMEKVDYRKTFKKLYIPGPSPEITEVPSFRFAAIEGRAIPIHMNSQKRQVRCTASAMP